MVHIDTQMVHIDTQMVHIDTQMVDVDDAQMVDVDDAQTVHDDVVDADERVPTELHAGIVITTRLHIEDNAVEDSPTDNGDTTRLHIEDNAVEDSPTDNGDTTKMHIEDNAVEDSQTDNGDTTMEDYGPLPNVPRERLPSRYSLRKRMAKSRSPREARVTKKRRG